MRIAFNRIEFGEAEERAVLSALRKGWVSGGGPQTLRVEKFLERRLGSPRVLATTSCSSALEMAVGLSGLGPGDEVILPSFTYPSTANCVLAAGARPVFADVAPDGMNAGLGEIQARATDKTRAVVAVHYGGIAKDLPALRRWCDDAGLVLIEDAAQALGSSVEQKPLGAWGEFGCFSFHGTKNFKAGEGGALVFSPMTAGRVPAGEVLRNAGTDKDRFLRGEVEAYEWVAQGAMHLPSDLLMALLMSQLKRMDAIMGRRLKIFKAYEALAAGFDEAGLFADRSRMPRGQETFNAHLFYLVFETEALRQAFQEAMAAADVQTATHYRPLHASAMGRRLGWRADALPETMAKAPGLVRLPLYEAMTEAELERVLDSAQRVLALLAKGRT